MTVKQIPSIVILLSILVTMDLRAQTKSDGYIGTDLGKIYYIKNEVPNSTPVIFLHGVYFDHRLWDTVTSELVSNTTVVIDMPMHGSSKEGITEHWSMSDVANMLIQVLDGLGIDSCYAIGHSWGSMTILRSASQSPNRFAAIGLANMPISAGTAKRRRAFKMQHTMLGFRRFYSKQAAKSLYAKESIEANPLLEESLYRSLSQMKRKEIIQTDKAVIMNVDSGRPYIENLTLPVIGLVGKYDYVQVASEYDIRVIEGGHVSPLEAPSEFQQFVNDVINLGE